MGDVVLDIRGDGIIGMGGGEEESLGLVAKEGTRMRASLERWIDVRLQDYSLIPKQYQSTREDGSRNQEISLLL